jgi:hypothetical protein
MTTCSAEIEEGTWFAAGEELHEEGDNVRRGGDGAHDVPEDSYASTQRVEESPEEEQERELDSPY